jgi:hypothetical protein
MNLYSIRKINWHKQAKLIFRIVLLCILVSALFLRDYQTVLGYIPLWRNLIFFFSILVLFFLISNTYPTLSSKLYLLLVMAVICIRLFTFGSQITSAIAVFLTITMLQYLLGELGLKSEYLSNQ